jgi:hypothetical protein
MAEIVLPTKKKPAECISPKNIIIFSKPKCGKSSLVADLEDCLVLDLEDGTDYLEVMSIKARSAQEISEIGKKIKEAGYPYKYLAVDTITALEDLSITYAEQLYSRSSQGKNWFTPESGGKAKYGNILNMPDGAGYAWLRQAFTTLTDYLKTLAPRVIFLGHVKDKLLAKEGSEFSSMDLDLTGKLKRITMSNCDTIGYMYRKDNQNILSFKTSDEVSCGARAAHLRNQEIVVSELIDGKLVTHWDKIFID